MDIKSKDSNLNLPEAALLANTAKSQASEKTAKAEATHNGQGAAAARSGQVRRDSYQVALSPQSKELKEAHQKAYDVASQTPSTREERVRELQEKIKNGSYQVDAGKIADGMLREAIREKLAESE